MDQTSAIIEWNSDISNIYDNYIFIFWGQTYMIIIYHEVCMKFVMWNMGIARGQLPRSPSCKIFS